MELERFKSEQEEKVSLHRNELENLKAQIQNVQYVESEAKDQISSLTKTISSPPRAPRVSKECYGMVSEIGCVTEEESTSILCLIFVSLFYFARHVRNYVIIIFARDGKIIFLNVYSPPISCITARRSVV